MCDKGTFTDIWFIKLIFKWFLLSDERNCDYSESVSSLSDKSEHSLDNHESLFNHESSLDNLEHSIDNQESVLKRHSENAEHSKENSELSSEAEHEKKSGSSHRSVGSKVVEPILHQNSGNRKPRFVYKD